MFEGTYNRAKISIPLVWILKYLFMWKPLTLLQLKETHEGLVMTWCLISRHNYFQELWNIGFQVFTNWYISYYLRINMILSIVISIFNIHIKIKWFWNILERVLSLCGLDTGFHFSSFQRIICDQQFIFNKRLIVVQNNEKPKTFKGTEI